MKKYSHKEVLFANRDYYNKVAEDYRENERYAYSKNIIDDVTRIIKNSSTLLDKRERFLDFGCGSGFLSELVFKYNIFERAIGVDVSKRQVDLYKKKFNSKRFWSIVSDTIKLPFDSHAFDMAACYSVLHHILDYKSAIREVTRVLKPNGILYVDFEPNGEFRKLMSVPVLIRRKILDKAPHNLEHLENLAEYHHNIERGIDRTALVDWLSDDYDILEVKPRYPQCMSKPVLKFLFNFNWSFAPYFYVVARKL